MRLHVLVEGAGDAAFIEAWRCLPAGHDVRVYPHRGKGRLPTDPAQRPDPRRPESLHQLPAKLRAFGKSLDSATERVLVLVDADEQDCGDLKQRLVALLAAIEPRPVVAFCIAVEETEAFFLGDRRALRAAYPRADLSKLVDYVQDSVCGTAELLQAVVGDAIADKRAWAERITPHLSNAEPGRRGANVSPSFHFLRAQMLTLAGADGARSVRRAGKTARPRRAR